MRELKADLHLHTTEDPYDVVAPTAREMIDRAAGMGYEVLAITNHLTRTYTEELAEYAARKGILLIPGAEIVIGLKHIVVLNPTDEALAARSFETLRQAVNKNGRPMAVIAPHPFLPSIASPARCIYDHVDIFDALEHTAYYFRLLNYNRRTRRIARRLGLALVGNSDAHYSWQFGRTYSMIRAQKTVEGVIEAIKKGKSIKVISRPLPINRITMRIGLRGLHIPEYMLWKEWREGDPYWDKA